MWTMHHHIRSTDSKDQLFKAQTLKSLESQTIWLKSNHTDAFEMTFDDGLKSHLGAAKLLTKHGVKGRFYYPTQIFESKKILNVHLVHFLLTNLNPELTSKLHQDLAFHSDLGGDPKDTEFVYRKQIQSEMHYNIKTLVNYTLKPNVSRPILIKYITDHTNIDEVVLFEQIYLNQDEILKIADQGHIVEPHFHSHTLLGLLNYDELKNEFSKCVEIHNQIFKKNVTALCVPYGSKNSWTSECEIICKSYNIKEVVLVDEIDQILVGYDEDLVYVSRMDCNQIPNFEYC